MPMSLFSVGHLLGMQLSFKISLFAQWDSLGANWFFFICKHLSFGDWFWVMDYDMHAHLLSALGLHLVQTVQTLWMLPQSLWVHMCTDSVNWVVLVSLMSSVPSAPYSLSASSSTEFPHPQEEGFDGYILFRGEYSKVSHSLHILFWVSIFVLIC